MPKRWLVGGLALLLVAVGCGDDDDDTAPVTAAAPADTSATTTTAAAPTTTAAAPTTTAAASTTTAAAATTTAAAATTAASAAPSPTTAAGGGGGGSEPACAPVGDIATAVSTVDYTLDEFSFEGPAQLTAGAVGFQLVNVGQAPHELVVISADSYESLPKNENGTVEEDQLPAGAAIGEVERFPGGGETCSGVFDLDPGRYVLVCNIEFQNGPQIISHAGRGMTLDVEVTA